MINIFIKLYLYRTEPVMADKANAKNAVVKKPPIETASWCFRDKEEDVHHDFAWTITNFSRKINLVPNGEWCGVVSNAESVLK